MTDPERNHRPSLESEVSRITQLFVGTVILPCGAAVVFVMLGEVSAIEQVSVVGFLAYAFVVGLAVYGCWLGVSLHLNRYDRRPMWASGLYVVAGLLAVAVGLVLGVSGVPDENVVTLFLVGGGFITYGLSGKNRKSSAGADEDAT